MKGAVYQKTGLTLLAGLAVAAGALVLFAWLAEEVLEGDTQLFDEQVRARLHQHATPALTAAMRFCTEFGATALLLALCVCIGLALWLRQRRRAALLLLVTLGGALALNALLKLAFHRLRPAPFFGLIAPLSYSFPSGHALLSCSFYGALAAILTARMQSRRGRLCVWAAAALLVALVGLSRVYLGVHYPSDVVAGYAAALIWVLTIALADRLLRRRSGAVRTN
jgi:undecaprenyl-diphosphatase